MNATTTNGLREHFAFLRERYQILLRRRAGQPAPWTDDPILRVWRFTNVRREDDRTTIAFRETVRDPLRDDPHVLLATIAWRWFNLIETGEALRPFLMSKAAWNRPEVERLLQARHDAGNNIFTGAYMVNSEQNRPKLPAVLDYIDWCYRNIDPEQVRRTYRRKAELFRRLADVPRLGNFSAYQVVVDLQYTRLLERAPDLDTFTVAGPGCAKGIGRCFEGREDAFSYGSARPGEDAVPDALDVEGVAQPEALAERLAALHLVRHRKRFLRVPEVPQRAGRQPAEAPVSTRSLTCPPRPSSTTSPGPATRRGRVRFWARALTIAPPLGSRSIRAASRLPA